LEGVVFKVGGVVGLKAAPEVIGLDVEVFKEAILSDDMR
jgi:hypothetical protein